MWLTYHNITIQVLATAWAIQKALPSLADLSKERVTAQARVRLVRCVVCPEWEPQPLAGLLLDCHYRA